MNIYEKLNLCKKELHSSKLTKSGKNDYTKKSYFQLNDFLPTIMELCFKHKLNTCVSFPSFPNKEAVLNIINTEEPKEWIKIKSPFGSAELKGCHEVQNIGAVETYQRRYLYMAAFDIIENDILDSGIVQPFDVDINKIKKCQTMDELSTVWAKIYNNHKTDKAGITVLTREKDIMKETLTLSGGEV